MSLISSVDVSALSLNPDEPPTVVALTLASVVVVVVSVEYASFSTECSSLAYGDVVTVTNTVTLACEVAVGIAHGSARAIELVSVPV